MNLILIYDRKAKVKKIRQNECDRQGDTDYYYALMLAQRESKNEIASLIKMQKFLKAQAQNASLPIYMETTSKRLLPLYERFGYIFHDSCYDGLSGRIFGLGGVGLR